ncbi:MAG: histidine phosphatase family protein [Prolixibacteraceae bacterium]|nr:histidine phosphatase family protein [Prolixibacteraceae bacterium]
MKRVVIVRHAKAVSFGYDNDFDRDLRRRGKEDAKIVSEELRKLGVMPCALISSPAKRALETARIFSETLGFNEKNIIEKEEIYDGLTTSGFVELIHDLPEEAVTAFFFGHNPGFYYFALNFCNNCIEEMPTCSAVGIDFDVEHWSQVKSRTGEKAFQLIPKMFK